MLSTFPRLRVSTFSACTIFWVNYSFNTNCVLCSQANLIVHCFLFLPGVNRDLVAAWTGQTVYLMSLPVSGLSEYLSKIGYWTGPKRSHLPPPGAAHIDSCSPLTAPLTRWCPESQNMPAAVHCSTASVWTSTLIKDSVALLYYIYYNNSKIVIKYIYWYKMNVYNILNIH